MTLVMRTDTMIPVQAWALDDKLQLTVGSTYAFLTKEQAVRLSEYLTRFVGAADNKTSEVAA